MRFQCVGTNAGRLLNKTMLLVFKDLMFLTVPYFLLVNVTVLCGLLQSVCIICSISNIKMPSVDPSLLSKAKGSSVIVNSTNPEVVCLFILECRR
jgi:hypothetical protein